METREVPVEQWRPFLDQFSRAHRGRRLSVETPRPDIGFQPNLRGLPLIGVTAEPNPDGTTSIEIMAGAPEAYMSHTIERPTRVREAEWGDGTSAALQIEAEGGWTTLVRVGPASEVLPHGFVSDAAATATAAEQATRPAEHGAAHGGKGGA